MIKTADYIVDLGPEGGLRGGRVIAKGTPEKVAATAGSATGEYLQRVLRGEPLVPLTDVTFAEEAGRVAPTNGRRGKAVVRAALKAEAEAGGKADGKGALEIATTSKRARATAAH